MFRSLIGEIKKKTSRSNHNILPIDLPPHLLGPDKEEDGFLVLGESSIERTTVLPPHKQTLNTPTASSTFYIDLPPSYESQVYIYISAHVLIPKIHFVKLGYSSH